MSSGGNLLSAFLDFDLATTTASISQRMALLDSTRKRRYLWSRWKQGDGVDPKMVSAGKSLSFNIILSPRSTYTAYKSGASGNPTNTNHLVQGESEWSFNRANKMYEDAEILLNENIMANARAGNTEAVVEQFAKVRDLKNSYLYEDLADGPESQLWATPDKFIHEKPDITTGTPEPMPIMAIVNEDANGLWGENYTGNTWTTKQSIDPTVAEYGDNYKPQQQTYSNFTANDKTNVLGGFDSISKDISFDQPANMNEYWENPALNQQVIVTSRWGHSEIQNLYRSGQNLYAVGGQDPSYPDPLYFGIPITWNDSFGAGVYYDDGSNGIADETTADITGPRFLWLNGNYICPVLHPQRNFEQDAPARDATDRPDTWVIWVTLWTQMMYPSVRRHGIVYPDTDITP